MAPAHGLPLRDTKCATIFHMEVDSRTGLSRMSRTGSTARSNAWFTVPSGSPPPCSRATPDSELTFAQWRVLVVLAAQRRPARRGDRHAHRRHRVGNQPLAGPHGTPGPGGQRTGRARPTSRRSCVSATPASGSARGSCRIAGNSSASFLTRAAGPCRWICRPASRRSPRRSRGTRDGGPPADVPRPGCGPLRRRLRSAGYLRKWVVLGALIGVIGGLGADHLLHGAWRRHASLPGRPGGLHASHPGRRGGRPDHERPAPLGDPAGGRRWAD